MLKIPQSFLRSLAIAKQLSEGELEVLYRITEDQSIDTIAEELKTSPSAIYQRLAQIYTKFGVKGKGPGKLSRLQLLLTSEYENSDFSQKNLFIQENDEITTISQIHSTSIPTQFSTMTKPSTLFSREYQPSDWLKESLSKIGSDKDINYILAEFPEHLSGAVDYLAYPSPPGQKISIFKALFSHIEKFFIESEKKKNYVPPAKDFQLSLGWNQKEASCQEEKSVISIYTPILKENIPVAQAMKLDEFSQS